MLLFYNPLNALTICRLSPAGRKALSAAGHPVRRMQSRTTVPVEFHVAVAVAFVCGKSAPADTGRRYSQTIADLSGLKFLGPGVMFHARGAMTRAAANVICLVLNCARSSCISPVGSGVSPCLTWPHLRASGAQAEWHNITTSISHGNHADAGVQVLRTSAVHLCCMHQPTTVVMACTGSRVRGDITDALMQRSSHA